MAKSRTELDEIYSRWTQYPLLALALAYLVMYAWPIVAPQTSPNTVQSIEVANGVIWGIFLLDVVIRACLAPSVRAFLRKNWLEVLAVAIPFLRPLRGLRIISIGLLAARRLSGAVQYRIAIYGVGITLLIVFIAGLAVTDAERNAETANIHNAFQGWWWAFITLATVGYGDKYPVTPEGQWIAVGVVVAGIGLLGTVSATIASVLLTINSEREKEILKEEEDQTKKIAALTSEVRALRADLAKILSSEKGRKR